MDWNPKNLDKFPVTIARKKDSYENLFAYKVVQNNVKENFHILSFLLAFLVVKLFKSAMVDSVRSSSRFILIIGRLSL